ASLTAEQRKSAENGIWCCQNCGKEVDDDESKFTVDRLRELRGRAENLAAERLGFRAQRGPDLADAEIAARSAGGAVLKQWQSIYHFDEQLLVQLDLREHETTAHGAESEPWSLE